MSENIIDWLIWEILKLNDDVSNHHHTSFFTPINSQNNLYNSEPFNIYREMERLKARKEELNRNINNFEALKKKIYNNPCPIIAMKQELDEIILKIPELEKKRLEVIKPKNDPTLREKMLDELHSQFDKEQK